MPVTDIIYDKGGQSTTSRRTAPSAMESRTTPRPSRRRSPPPRSRSPTIARPPPAPRGASSTSPWACTISPPPSISPAGCSIRGAGMRTTQLRFFLSNTADGLVWTRGTREAAVPRGRVPGRHRPDDMEPRQHEPDRARSGGAPVVAVVRDQPRAHLCGEALQSADQRLREHLGVPPGVARGGHVEPLRGQRRRRGYSTTVRFVGCYFQGTPERPGGRRGGARESASTTASSRVAGNRRVPGRTAAACAGEARCSWHPTSRNNPDWEIIAARGVVRQPGHGGDRHQPTITPGQGDGGGRCAVRTRDGYPDRWKLRPQPATVLVLQLDGACVRGGKTYPGQPDVDRRGLSRHFREWCCTQIQPAGRSSRRGWRDTRSVVVT